MCTKFDRGSETDATVSVLSVSEVKTELVPSTVCVCVCVCVCTSNTAARKPRPQRPRPSISMHVCVCVCGHVFFYVIKISFFPQNFSLTARSRKNTQFGRVIPLWQYL